MNTSNQPKIYNGEDVSDIGVKKIFDDSVRQLETQLSAPNPGNVITDPDSYNFQHRVRGFGIVFSIGNFTNGLRKRSYANNELISMNEMLTKLEFQVLLFTDVTAEQIKDVLTEAASRQEVHEKADTFACIIGSHGNESNDDDLKQDELEINYEQGQHAQRKTTNSFHHVVYGTDKPVLTRNLIRLFEDDNCPGLTNKPRIFFLQSCRKRRWNFNHGNGAVEMQLKNDSDESNYTDNETDEIDDQTNDSDNETDDTDDETNDSDNETDGTDNEQDQDIEEKETASPDNLNENMFGGKKKKKKKITVYSPYCPNHFCLIYATPEANLSFGRKKKGGWMLHEFSEVIKQSCEYDLLTLSTTVCNNVAIRYQAKNKRHKGAKTAVVIEHRLTGDVNFKKKN